MKEFEPAIWSSKVRRCTIGMLVFMGVLAIVAVTLGIDTMRTGPMVIGVLSITVLISILLLMVTLAWATVPRSYIVSENGVTIRFRCWKSIEIAYDNIADIAQAGHRDVFDQAFISHNMAYMFSAAGTYWSPKLNDFECLCTNQEDLVVIKRKHGNPVVISPADSHGFVEASRNPVKHEGQND